MCVREVQLWIENFDHRRVRSPHSEVIDPVRALATNTNFVFLAAERAQGALPTDHPREMSDPFEVWKFALHIPDLFAQIHQLISFSLPP